MTASIDHSPTPPPPGQFRLKSLLGLFAIAAAALGIFVGYRDYQRLTPVYEIYGGYTGLKILQDPDRVAAYRIAKLPLEFDGNRATLSDYPIESGPIAVPTSVSEQIATALSVPEAYGWDYAKACIIRPGVRIDFIRGNDQLQILFCFECTILVVFLNGEAVGGEDFDNARPALVRAVRKLFPNDAKIQALDE